VRLSQIRRPLAITIWDFSRLERRWPGSGYEDWDRILDVLVQRGYAAEIRNWPMGITFIVGSPLFCP
jgi:sugar phosphate isomerase/epimerase